MNVSGDYNKTLDSLNLSEIKADLLNARIEENAGSNAKITMSILLSDLTNTLANKSDFYIRLENVGKGGLEKFWPTFLPGQDIRKWVIDHIYDENINDAYAKFTLQKHNGTTTLEKLDSKIAFENLNIKYDEYFPKITSAKGHAIFTKKGMNIFINDAKVLESKISNAEVSLEDFSSEKTFLNIKGNLVGKASDGLKHANYNSKFALEIEKYLNGESFGNFSISLPLHEEISLKTIFLAAKLDIKSLKNDYVAGDVKIDTVKDFKNNLFITSIDLTNAALTAKAFDIEKKVGDKSSLSFILNVKNDDLLQFKNLVLTKEEKVLKKDNVNFETSNAKISANFDLLTSSLKILTLNIKNEEFGKNKYQFSYSNKADQEFLSITGQYLNLGALLENKISNSDNTNKDLSSSNSNSIFADNLVAKIYLDKILMAKNRSINKFYLAINRKNKSYKNIIIKGSQGNKKLINIATESGSGQKLPSIVGNVSDIGYLAEAFNISDTVSGGQAKLNIDQSFIGKNLLLKGKIEIDNDITFYETNAVKRLEKDNLFVKVKDKIFSNNKTTFGKVKLAFNVIDNKVEIESFLANNYKIGITAKGFYNVTNNSYEIKGMIIPGFVVNNLFGIGNIPLTGGVISGLLTGGEGGGLFGIKYEYKKASNEKEPTFKTDVVSAFVPVSIRNLFDSI